MDTCVGRKLRAGVWIAVLACSAGGCGEPFIAVIEPLRVINWSPQDGTVCVRTDATVYASFSDDLVPDTVTPETFFVEEGDVVLSMEPTYDEATFTVRLDPDQGLAYGQRYAVVATTQIEGREQGNLNAELRVSFETIKRGGCGENAECVLPSDCDAIAPGMLCATDGTCVACQNNNDCLVAYGTGSACVGGGCVAGGSP